MLKKLFIQNYAIIDNLELSLPGGLNIITGETGAGKSILLGAIGLIMGKRADSKVLFDQDRKCIVEAEINISEYNLRDYFQTEELDYFDDLTIRREIAPGGKSRGFVNDTPVTLDLLQQLTDKLIVVHQQFDMLDIQKPSFQLEVLDALAENKTLLAQYRSTYKKLMLSEKAIELLTERQRNSKNEAEFLLFQLDELEKMNIKDGELEEAEQTLSVLNATEDIKKIFGLIANILEDRDGSVNQHLRNLMQQLDQLAQINPQFSLIRERLDNCYEELSDVAKESAVIAENTEYDPRQIEVLNERLSQIYRVLKKHNVQDVKALIELCHDLRSKYSGIVNLDSEIVEKEREIAVIKTSLRHISVELSDRRKKAITGFETNINATIKQLGMEHAQVRIELTPLETAGPDGCDEVSYLFAPNKGSKFLPLKNIASGGEISRLTLCIKSFIAGAMTLPTLIFDEIDTGVSGEIARKMGSLLSQLAVKHQVISISHAPQIAAKADTQFFVYKMDSDSRTITSIRQLQKEERQYEIARMLSGDPPTPSALANAAELLQHT